MVVIDEFEGWMSAPVTTSVTVQPLNDEPPTITNTSSTVIFTEEGGSIRIVDGDVAIVDLDNCENHTTVIELVVRLENPIEGEDQLIVGGQVHENYTATFSCDMEVNSSCYEEFLQRITYNNTNTEPDPLPRIVSIQVWYLQSVIASCTFIPCDWHIYVYRLLTRL